jgi:hypothetical protein
MSSKFTAFAGFIGASSINSFSAAGFALLANLAGGFLIGFVG